MSDYDVVIGLEIHSELNTKSKVFCSCRNVFGSSPNTNCCPVCIALPGTLPIINKQAVKSTIKAGLALDCNINSVAVFERKNYFYPDLSKAYQISQLIKPICLNGGIELDSGKFVRLNRIHLEEDAGKLIHNPSSNTSLVDYNRAGVPLIEIVTEPDISNAEEAIEFVTKLRNILIYTGVADCKMEEGGLRCDVNLSIKPKGSSTLGTRTEMKNLNSFKMIKKAIESEQERQISLLEKGERIVQETRRWDDEAEESYSMRSKETSQDYRYFPDPDILAINISKEDIEKISATIPPLPAKLKYQLINHYGLTEYEADILVKEKETSTFFFDSLNLFEDSKTLSNWTLNNILAKLKDSETSNIAISPKQFVDIVKMEKSGKISKKNALILVDELWNTEGDAETKAKELNMINTMTENELYTIIDKILLANEKAVSQYSTEGDKIVNFLIGQVMKETKGKANNALARTYIVEKLSNM